MPWECRVAELEEKPSGDTAEILTGIYESSFPPWEREPAADVFNGAPDHTLLCAYSGDQIVGFGDVFSLGGRDGLLRYLAVSEEHRSLGVGRRILDHIAERFADLEYLLLEVESPADSPDASLAARRIGFYERWGAREIRCINGYFFPSALNLTDRVPAVLMERHTSGPGLYGPRLREALSHLYDCYYGADVNGAHMAELLSRVIC